MSEEKAQTAILRDSQKWRLMSEKSVYHASEPWQSGCCRDTANGIRVVIETLLMRERDFFDEESDEYEMIDNLIDMVKAQ